MTPTSEVSPRPWAPPWAVVADHPCVTVRCSHCGQDENGDDAEFTPHYGSVDEALKSVAEGGGWAQDGDRLLCRTCAGEILCPRDGHAWEHSSYPAWTRSDGVKVPAHEYWDCKYCDEATSVDPTPAPGPDRPTLLDVPEAGR